MHTDKDIFPSLKNLWWDYHIATRQTLAANFHCALLFADLSCVFKKHYDKEHLQMFASQAWVRKGIYWRTEMNKSVYHYRWCLANLQDIDVLIGRRRTEWAIIMHDFLALTNSKNWPFCSLASRVSAV